MEYTGRIRAFVYQVTGENDMVVGWGERDVVEKCFYCIEDDGSAWYFG